MTYNPAPTKGQALLLSLLVIAAAIGAVAMAYVACRCLI